MEIPVNPFDTPVPGQSLTDNLKLSLGKPLDLQNRGFITTYLERIK